MVRTASVSRAFGTQASLLQARKRTNTPSLRGSPSSLRTLGIRLRCMSPTRTTRLPNARRRWTALGRPRG
eukprot:12829241-Alexandrium_andersonii.AAC.1